MPLPLRIEYPGACYHVMSRGDQREAIFTDDKDRAEFLRTLTPMNQKWIAQRLRLGSPIWFGLGSVLTFDSSQGKSCVNSED